MIQIISGVKGKGKTKFLIQKANEAVKAANGSVVYLDKNNKHMYELSNRVRLINVPEFNINSRDMFVGFLYGVVSQDYNLDRIFLDNFLTISCVDRLDEVEDLIRELEAISQKFEVDFVIGISKKKADLTDYLKDLVVVDL